MKIKYIDPFTEDAQKDVKNFSHTWLFHTYNSANTNAGASKDTISLPAGCVASIILLIGLAVQISSILANSTDLGLVLSWRKPHARTHTQSKMVAEGHE
jgi:hypothetical protein